MVGAGFGFAMALIVLVGRDETDARGSTQQCNTACQEKMTDCIIDCDGLLSCELNCKSAAVGCVLACTDGGVRPPEPVREPIARGPVDANVDSESDAMPKPAGKPEADAKVARDR
ncbi:MAG TPA: hypothetical protein VGL13_11515 [Polyangiaceae bacterium]